jgi:hypothetical protein
VDPLITKESSKLEEVAEEYVSFRDLVPDIPSTTYASHGMYYYPARFIPQVVRWTIEKYTSPRDWVIDPFAGSGTVCVEAKITNRNSVCLDLNPMLEYLIDAKTYTNASWEDLADRANKVLENDKCYRPKWSRIGYWYPKEFFEILSKMWDGYYRNPHPLLLIALLKSSKRFSYADDTVPKLFRSKIKEKEISRILLRDYKLQIQNYFIWALRDVYTKSLSFKRLFRGGESIVRGGVNLLEYDFNEREYQLLLTSPPYGLAHEYIRSFKLELAWLGFSDEQITRLINSEIPYNENPPEIDILSQTYSEYLPRVKPHVRQYCDVYFRSVLFILEKVMNKLKPNGVAAIFVGNATFSGVEFPFHRIFREHLESKGYMYERLLVDKIKSRKLFKGRLNPSPNGIASEYLLVLRRPK